MGRAVPILGLLSTLPAQGQRTDTVVFANILGLGLMVGQAARDNMKTMSPVYGELDGDGIAIVVNAGDPTPGQIYALPQGQNLIVTAPVVALLEGKGESLYLTLSEPGHVIKLYLVHSDGTRELQPPPSMLDEEGRKRLYRDGPVDVTPIIRPEPWVREVYDGPSSGSGRRPASWRAIR